MFLAVEQASSIERPECPTMEDYKLVRANIMTSGYLFRPVPNSADYMEVSQAVFIIVIIIFNVVLGLYIYCHRKQVLFT